MHFASIPFVQSESAVATQALVFMNDPHVREFALAFARSLSRAQEGLEPAVVEVFRRALCREPTHEELAASIDFVRRQASSYSGTGEHAPTDVEVPIEALADLCQVVFSSNEFSYVE